MIGAWGSAHRMPRRLRVFAVCVLLASSCAVCAETVGRAVPLGIGFRGDGSGIFPGDCNPPSEFDGVAGKNLIWKTPLPNYGNGSPIVVGRKVFVTCAAGWPEGADCAVLICHDGDTGKELWKRELDEFATMPEPRAREAREVRKEYHRRIRRLNTLLYEYQSADDGRKDAIFAEAGSIAAVKRESFDKNSMGTGSADQSVYGNRAFAGKLRDVCAYSPITWSPTTLGVDMPTPVSDGRRVYVYTGRRTVYAFDLDGNMVWQVWQSDAPYNYHWVTDCANSPVIVGDLLLMYCFDHLWAYDTATGRLRYRVESKAPFRHGMGHPVVLRLPLADGKAEPALYLWTGDLVRVRDGRMLCRSVAPLDCAALGGDGVDRVFLGIHGESKGKPARDWVFRGEGQGGALGVRFALKGDVAAAEKLWFNAKNDGYKALSAYPICRGDRLWIDSGHIVDAGTGKALNASKLIKGHGIAYNGFISAGGYIYGIQKSRVNEGSGGAGGLGKQQNLALLCTVAKEGADRLEGVGLCPVEFLPAKITEPAKRAQVVAMTSLDRYRDWYGWHEAYSAPFAGGNRLFIRTFDDLYCFGDPSRPFTPSATPGGMRQ